MKTRIQDWLVGVLVLMSIPTGFWGISRLGDQMLKKQTLFSKPISLPAMIANQQPGDSLLLCPEARTPITAGKGNPSHTTSDTSSKNNTASTPFTTRIQAFKGFKQRCKRFVLAVGQQGWKIYFVRKNRRIPLLFKNRRLVLARLQADVVVMKSLPKVGVLQQRELAFRKSRSDKVGRRRRSNRRRTRIQRLRLSGRHRRRLRKNARRYDHRKRLRQVRKKKHHRKYRRSWRSRHYSNRRRTRIQRSQAWKRNKGKRRGAPEKAKLPGLIIGG